MPDTTARPAPTTPAPRPPARGWLARKAHAALARRARAELDRLVRHDPRWRFLPGAVVADGVDHLAIGPAGVFALSCTGAASADLVGERLSAATGIPVRAHLVLVTADAVGDPGPATVVRRERLRSFLHTRPDRLAPVTVERLHAAARDAGTWGPAPA